MEGTGETEEAVRVLLLLWVRADQPRETGMGYWKGPHSKIISATKGFQEYRQMHLAVVNPGLWPTTRGVQTDIPVERKIDGVAEVTFQSALSPLLGRKQTRLAFKDEVNVFRRTLLYIGPPNSSRWYEVAAPGEQVGAVLVTGANGGIGTHFVHQALAREAAKVYATARTPRPWGDERIVPLTLDVTDAASIAAAAAAAPDVTALINNAGAIPPSASLLELTEADLRANMDPSFFGPVFLARACAPILQSKPQSVLVDVHSVASWYAFGGIYSASKAALWSATNSLRLELAPGGVHVTGVHVGYVETPMAAHADGPKMQPTVLVTKVYDAVEAGEYEVIADELTAQVRAALSGPVVALYPELRDTRAPLIAVEE